MTASLTDGDKSVQLEATTITVPVPLHATLMRGTLASIVRQSELTRSLFEAD